MTRPDFLKRAEWTVGLLLSAMAIFLLAVRAGHAGALWRDECAVVQLAGMPSVSDVLRNFQHEAFPPLFPLIVRIYAIVFGSSDTVLRIFGFAVGCLLISAFWINSRLFRTDAWWQQLSVFAVVHANKVDSVPLPSPDLVKSVSLSRLH